MMPLSNVSTPAMAADDPSDAPGAWYVVALLGAVYALNIADRGAQGWAAVRQPYAA